MFCDGDMVRSSKVPKNIFKGLMSLPKNGSHYIMKITLKILFIPSTSALISTGDKRKYSGHNVIGWLLHGNVWSVIHREIM